MRFVRSPSVWARRDGRTGATLAGAPVSPHPALNMWDNADAPNIAT